MKRRLIAFAVCAIGRWRVALVCLFVCAAGTVAQTSPPATTGQVKVKTKAAISAMLLSDIHFEPFWDPGRVPQLAAAPVTEWTAILASSPSPDQQQRFQSLQQTCHVRGADTSFALFASSLKAMRSHADDVKFVTVSGDLLSHAFQCKFTTLFPKSTAAEYRTFAEKTVDYVIDELDGNLPGVPVYVGLGNNDSDCGDYRLDAHGEFLRVTAKEVTRGFPASERQAAEDSFAEGGYYGVSLPAPLENARLLVLNDIFMSSNYSTCAGKPDPGAAAVQLAWLRQQLTQARANKQKIWVMGHIPPGVDLYSTVKKMSDICGGQKPTMFLSTEKLAGVIAEFSDVIELAVFAHTHMDELRLLRDREQNPASPKAVVLKMVPSISPINGNHPSFTIAEIDPATAALKDYRVFVSSNLSGIDARWQEEYDFARSIHESEFSSTSLSKLIAGFAADPTAKAKSSQSYIKDFSAGSPSTLLSLVWPQYVCTLSNDIAETFRACVCSTKK